MSTHLVSRMAWAGLLALVSLGLLAVALRAAFPADAGSRLEPVRAAILDRLGRSDPLAAARAAAVADFDRPFAAYPVVTALHIGAGGLFLLLVPLQLCRGFRTRHPAVHRIFGRASLGAGFVMVLTALHFGVLHPFAGRIETLVVSLVSAWYSWATIRAVSAARRGDFVSHREWMLRAIAVPLGVSMARVASLALDLALLERGIEPAAMFVLAISTGWAATIGVAEWWIRTTRVASRRAELQPLRAA